MTNFEQMLLSKGYVKYIFNCKTMDFELAKGHTLSSMVNIDHRYFHNTDPIINKIENGNYSWEDRKGEIIFGLHEKDHPPTLISPRPNIRVKRIKNKKEIIEDQNYDDSMNVVLEKFPDEEILKAMYNKKIILEIDLT